MSKQVEYYYTYEVKAGVVVSALHDPRLTFSATKVLANLIGVHAYNKYPSGVDEKGRKVGCFPSIATIASELQISEWTVVQAIDLLWKLEYIKINKSMVNNVHQRNEYIIARDYKTTAQIQAEGKARRQRTSEKPRKAGRKHSAETRAKMSAAHQRRRLSEVGSSPLLGLPNDPLLGLPNDPLLGLPNDPLLGGPYTNVENKNIVKLNVEKERSGFACVSSSSPLDTSQDVLSSDNEVDLSPDTSQDVRSSPKTLSSTRKRFEASGRRSDPSDVTSSLDTHWDRVARKQQMYDEEREVLKLTDEDLGVTSSPDDNESANFAERKAKIAMRQAQVRQKYASLFKVPAETAQVERSQNQK